MDESARQRWHAEFESRAPQTHYEFLLSLGVPENEAEQIQQWLRDSNTHGSSQSLSDNSLQRWSFLNDNRSIQVKNTSVLD